MNNPIAYLTLPLVVAACVDRAPPSAGRHDEALDVADEAGEVEVLAGVHEVHGRGESRSAGDPGDLDQDGVPAEADVDDFNELVGAPRPEILCDGVDQDGDLADPCSVDVDLDGAVGEGDCDDLDPAIGPHAREIWCNGRDENCNGTDDCDRDGDGLRDVDDPAPDDGDAAIPGDDRIDRWR